MTSVWEDGHRLYCFGLTWMRLYANWTQPLLWQKHSSIFYPECVYISALCLPYLSLIPSGVQHSVIEWLLSVRCTAGCQVDTLEVSRERLQTLARTNHSPNAASDDIFRAHRRLITSDNRALWGNMLSYVIQRQWARLHTCAYSEFWVLHTGFMYESGITSNS